MIMTIEMVPLPVGTTNNLAGPNVVVIPVLMLASVRVECEVELDYSKSYFLNMFSIRLAFDTYLASLSRPLTMISARVFNHRAASAP